MNTIRISRKVPFDIDTVVELCIKAGFPDTYVKYGRYTSESYDESYMELYLERDFTPAELKEAQPAINKLIEDIDSLDGVGSVEQEWYGATMTTEMVYLRVNFLGVLYNEYDEVCR